MNWIYIVAYIISVPVSFYLLLALTANHRSQVNEYGNRQNIDCGIANILYDSEYREPLKVWGIASFIPCVNLMCVIGYFTCQVINPKVGITTLLSFIFKKMYNTSYLLNRVSNEI